MNFEITRSKREGREDTPTYFQGCFNSDDAYFK